MSWNINISGVSSGQTDAYDTGLTSDQNVTEIFAGGIFYNEMRHPLYMTIIYTLAYTTIMLLAIVGNVMVVVVVVRNRSMHIVINYFIVNLAIADIMVALICLPMTLLSNLYVEWHFGWFMCKATPYLQGVSVCASVNTLAAIAVDRYIAICHSMEMKISSKGCKIIVFCIWIFAFGIMVPWAIHYQLGVYYVPSSQQNLTMCYEIWPNELGQRSYFLGAIFLCCYTVPLCLIVICYFLIGVRVWRRRAPGEKITNASGVVHKSKVKAIKMLVFVVVMFAFSWMPLYIIKLSSFYQPYGQLPSFVIDIINPIAQSLGSSNSGMNPIIYCFFSKKFRKGFKDSVTICCLRRQARWRRRHDMTSHTYINGNGNVSSVRNNYV